MPEASNEITGSENDRVCKREATDEGDGDMPFADTSALFHSHSGAQGDDSSLLDVPGDKMPTGSGAFQNNPRAFKLYK